MHECVSARPPMCPSTCSLVVPSIRPIARFAVLASVHQTVCMCGCGQIFLYVCIMAGQPSHMHACMRVCLISCMPGDALSELVWPAMTDPGHAWYGMTSHGIAGHCGTLAISDWLGLACKHTEQACNGLQLHCIVWHCLAGLALHGLSWAASSGMIVCVWGGVSV